MWEWAGRIYHEAIYRGSLAAAGSNTTRLVEKLGKDTRYIKRQARTIQIIGSFYLLFVSFLPAVTMAQIAEGTSHDWNMFVASIAGSIHFLVQTGYLMILTLVATSEILAPGLYLWPDSLPVSSEKAGMLRVFALGREFLLPLVVIIVSYPVVAGVFGGLLTGAATLVLSTSHAAMTLSVIVLASWRLRRALRAASGGGRKAALVRVLTMGGYALGIIVIIAIMQFGSNYILSLIDAPRIAAGGTVRGLRLISLVPLPNAAASLITALVARHAGLEHTLPLWQPLVGSAGYCTLSVLLLRAAWRLIGQKDDVAIVTSEVAQETRSLVVRSPRTAFRRQILQSATRDTQVLISLVFPVIIPIAFLAGPALSGAPSAVLVYVAPVVSAVMGGWMLLHGLARTQSGTGLLEAALPLVERDRVFPRIAIASAIPAMGALLGAIVLLPGEMKLRGAILSATPAVAVPVGFLVKVALFGRVGQATKRIVAAEVNIDYRFWKWVVTLLSIAVVSAGLVLVAFFLWASFRPVEAALIYLAGVGLCAVGVRSQAGRMFPSA